MKKIAILGSTGSIGISALQVIRHFRDKFRVVALSTNANINILLRQAKEFRPSAVCVSDAGAASKIKPRLNSSIRLFSGAEGLSALVAQEKIDQVLLATSGASALLPLLEAIKAGCDIALANKEALVAAGPLIMQEASRRKIKIIPIDSEQSAIWQCLEGEDKTKLKSIYLTASGGPLLKLKSSAFKDITVSRVLRHPRWKMGRKISVDSATLMNKGLEVLEAISLFGVPLEKIKVVIHPQAIIHSMVEFTDAVVLAQLSDTDMRIPIQYALSYPQRLPHTARRLDFYNLKALEFIKPDFKKFPCLGLAWRAARSSGTAPCVLNAANEAAVEAFLQARLGFADIPRVIEKVLDKHDNVSGPLLGDILAADNWARREAHRVIERLN